MNESIYLFTCTRYMDESLMNILWVVNWVVSQLFVINNVAVNTYISLGIRVVICVVG